MTAPRIQCPECNSERVVVEVYCLVRLEIVHHLDQKDYFLYGELEDFESINSPNEDDRAFCRECDHTATVSTFITDTE